MNTGNIEQTETGHRAWVKIKSDLGLHLRPASKLVKLASQFSQCEITLTKTGQTINAKSIMGVIMLAAERDSELLLEASGDQSEQAVESIAQFIESGFYSP